MNHENARSASRTRHPQKHSIPGGDIPLPFYIFLFRLPWIPSFPWFHHPSIRISVPDSSQHFATCNLQSAFTKPAWYRAFLLCTAKPKFF
jgi:hypothetical protein